MHNTRTYALPLILVVQDLASLGVAHEGARAERGLERGEVVQQCLALLIARSGRRTGIGDCVEALCYASQVALVVHEARVDQRVCSAPVSVVHRGK